ncbi:hypothetical protein IFM89_027918 [Coptis chinensis]|uniref:Uncharacterized protein n=1 Tax=Coptis chinensis TaxID=261450 RepID=A0A835HFM1_9MAGN|nr:hypothetical protein IFM89_027918 [Coptis chinensis]
MGRGKFKGKPTGKRNFSTHEEMGECSMQQLIRHSNRGDNLDAQIESLLNVEKQSRLAENVSATKKAVIDIIQLCYGARA